MLVQRYLYERNHNEVPQHIIPGLTVKYHSVSQYYVRIKEGQANIFTELFIQSRSPWQVLIYL